MSTVPPKIDLSGLRDVHLPGSLEADWWPPAIGWWIIFIIVLSLPFWLKIYNEYRIRTARYYALKEIDKLTDTYTNSPSKFAEEVSVLLRRIALLKYGKEEVASLSGTDWVSFLVRTGNLSIKKNLAMLFAVAPYARPQKFGKDSVAELKSAAIDWIKKNT